MSKITALVLAASMLCLYGVRPANAQIDAARVKAAIDGGVGCLRDIQSPNGSYGELALETGAVTSLCTLALLNCGVPADDEQVQRSLNYLRRLKPVSTYATSLQTMVFCIAEPHNQTLIRENAKWLESTQVSSAGMNGSWSYGNRSGSGDNSNAQFALLALYEAERVGVNVDQRTWQRAYDYFLSAQNPNSGSWGYVPAGGPGTGSMTCAGIAALIMAGDKLTAGDAQVENGEVQCCGKRADDTAIENGLAWLGRNFSVTSNPGNPGLWQLYYLYGLERVGRLTNRRLIGPTHDWYREGAELLVHRQAGDGSWTGTGPYENQPVLATSLALLFLSKGRRPVVISKAMHGPLDDWNHHRGDVGNLVAYAEKKWKMELTWQTIDVGSARTQQDLDDLYEGLVQTPVLWITGKLAPEFTDAQAALLRKYVDQGGFIFAESCCGGQDFDAGFRRLIEEIFPEEEFKLKLLDASHLAWHAEEPVPPEHVRPLYGVDIGCRTSVIYCPDGTPEESGRNALSCYWELARPGRVTKLPAHVQARVDASKAIGLNVLAYATNREVAPKLEVVPPTVSGLPQDDVERAKLYLGKIQHGGNWDAAPGALANLLKALARQKGLRVDEKPREFSLADDLLFEHHMVFMHGRNAFTLSQVERERLRQFVERGGLLFADAICASPQFAKSFRAEMAAVFPDKSLAPISADDALFSDKFGGSNLRVVKRREPGRRTAGGGVQAQAKDAPPELEGVRIDDRYGVIFSPYDLSCALERHEAIECPGYSRQDAARIGINVILYSLKK